MENENQVKIRYVIRDKRLVEVFVCEHENRVAERYQSKAGEVVVTWKCDKCLEQIKANQPQ